MITIVDYGMGNLRSVQKALERTGARVCVSDSPRAVRDARAVILPGVGAFGDCMESLERLRLIDPLLEAIEGGKPFLGICLGLQVLFTESHEFGRHAGLGVFPGAVERFARGLKVPHMGWNCLNVKRPAPLLRGQPPAPYFYFVHSYYVVPEDDSIVAATTDYGREFVSMVWKDNVYAAQFHPEKSQELGLRVLEEFAVLSERG